MKLITASAEIVQFTPNPLEVIERAYRVCYQSSMTGNAEQFIRDKIRRGHLSPLEHAVMTVRFVIDRGIGEEAIRHRIASPSKQSTRMYAM